MDDFIGKPDLLQLFYKLAFLSLLLTRESSHRLPAVKNPKSIKKLLPRLQDHFKTVANKSQNSENICFSSDAM